MRLPSFVLEICNSPAFKYKDCCGHTYRQYVPNAEGERGSKTTWRSSWLFWEGIEPYEAGTQEKTLDNLMKCSKKDLYSIVRYFYMEKPTGLATMNKSQLGEFIQQKLLAVETPSAASDDNPTTS